MILQNQMSLQSVQITMKFNINITGSQRMNVFADSVTSCSTAIRLNNLLVMKKYQKKQIAMKLAEHTHDPQRRDPFNFGHSLSFFLSPLVRPRCLLLHIRYGKEQSGVDLPEKLLPSGNSGLLNLSHLAFPLAWALVLY